MLDQELGASRVEVRIGREHTGTLNERVVGSCGISVGSGTSVVESREDAWWAFLFDKVADNLVVEVFDGCPLNLLEGVLLLLLLQCKLDENLLKLFVDVVDAKLLERVVVKDFESVDIEDTNDVGSVGTRIHGLVDALDDPVEHVVVDGFGESVSGSSGLSRVEGHLVDGTSSSASLGFHDALGQGFCYVAGIDFQKICNEVGTPASAISAFPS